MNTVLSQWMDEAKMVYTDAGRELQALVSGTN